MIGNENPNRVQKLSSSRWTGCVRGHNNLRAGREPGGHRVVANGDIDIDLLLAIKGGQCYGAHCNTIHVGDAIITIRILIRKMPGGDHLYPRLRNPINQQSSSNRQKNCAGWWRS